jgi:hypothetical protein
MSGTKGWTSDSGWGCMLRTTQSLLATALGRVGGAYCFFLRSCSFLLRCFFLSFLSLFLSPLPRYFIFLLPLFSPSSSFPHPRLSAPASMCQFPFSELFHILFFRVLDNECHWALALPGGDYWMAWSVWPPPASSIWPFCLIFILFAACAVFPRS